MKKSAKRMTEVRKTRNLLLSGMPAILSFAIFTCSITPAIAGDEKTGKETNKEKIARECFSLCGFEEACNQYIKLLLEDTVRVVSKQTRTDPNLTEEERNRTIRRLERFEKLFEEKVDMGSIIERIGVGLMAKHFSEAELKDIRAYYENPVGKKGMKLMPVATQEAIQTANDRLVPQLSQLMKQAYQEEMGKKD